MISLEEAKSILEQKFSGLKVAKALDYDSNYYLMLSDKSSKQYGDTYYIVGKDGKTCRFYNPLEDFDKFEAAMDRGAIKTWGQGSAISEEDDAEVL